MLFVVPESYFEFGNTVFVPYLFAKINHLDVYQENIKIGKAKKAVNPHK